MKKFIICSLQLLFVLLAATSCNDDEKQIDYEMLPERARQFIQLYFPTEQCVSSCWIKTTARQSMRPGSTTARNWSSTSGASG